MPVLTTSVNFCKGPFLHSLLCTAHSLLPAEQVKGIKDFIVDTCGVPADKFVGFRGGC